LSAWRRGKKGLELKKKKRRGAFCSLRGAVPRDKKKN